MLIISNHSIDNSAYTGFEWDDGKYQQTLEKRQISFIDASQLFEEYTRFTYISHNTETAEKRFVTVGLLKNKLFAVIYTIRAENIRIITARRAHVREERIYKTLYA